jgi:RNA polymerase sigma-70 factor, ECF subfamily
MPVDYTVGVLKQDARFGAAWGMLARMAQPAESPTEEKRLVLAFQQGQVLAYEVIYKRYSAVVERHCEYILRNPEDAQDAAQETFLRVYKNLHDFNGSYQLEAWIKRIATNVCLDHIRTTSRVATEGAFTLLHGEGPGRASDDPQQIVLRRSEVDRILKRARALPALQRSAFLLREMRDLSHRDIAALLHISESRTRLLVHRARKALRRVASAGSWVALWTRFSSRGPRARIFESTGSAVAKLPEVAARITPATTSLMDMLRNFTPITRGVATVATAAVVGAGAGLTPVEPPKTRNVAQALQQIAVGTADSIGELDARPSTRAIKSRVEKRGRSPKRSGVKSRPASDVVASNSAKSASPIPETSAPAQEAEAPDAPPGENPTTPDQPASDEPEPSEQDSAEGPQSGNDDSDEPAGSGPENGSAEPEAPTSPDGSSGSDGSSEPDSAEPPPEGAPSGPGPQPGEEPSGTPAGDEGGDAPPSTSP